MPRWDISDPDRIHSSEVRISSEETRKESSSASPSVGRGGSSDSSTEEVERRERPIELGARKPRERRAQHEDRGRVYSLRRSEMEAMTDMGRFRAVDLQDLARFVYRGDRAHMTQDLESLRAQGLVEQRTFFRAHKSTRKMVTLTERGYRIVAKASGLRKGQRIYHGFVKPRELDHDADLYKVYQKAVVRIEEQGGKPLRVRLDFELKEAINRDKEAASRLCEKDRAMRLRAVAEQQGLTIKGTTIHLPDIQIEYQTLDGRIERENLELLSQNYREQGIRGKAAAGFQIYARTGEASRIRRALRDTGFVREVLAV